MKKRIISVISVMSIVSILLLTLSCLEERDSSKVDISLGPVPAGIVKIHVIVYEGTITPETAREAHKNCEGLAAGITEKAGRPAAEKLFLEGQAESCIAEAMASGAYSDASGDSCSHHFSYATKVAEALRLARDEPLYAQQMEPILAEELRVAKEQGEIKGCKQDYGSLTWP